MYDPISTQAFVERNRTDAQKEIHRYQLRIDNAKAVAQEEIGKEYGSQIESLRAEVEGLKTERDQAHARIEKLAVAVLSGVPLKNAAMFAELIQGDNPDEYKADAERLLAMFRKV
jgi:hypothetical protein